MNHATYSTILSDASIALIELSKAQDTLHDESLEDGTVLDYYVSASKIATERLKDIIEVTIIDRRDLT